MANQPVTAIVELDRNRYKTKIFSGGHLIYADEPEALGGTDQGMAPASLLLASLGSCTAITVRMYADRKRIPLESMKLSLEICAENEMDAGTRIRRTIEFFGDLSEDQRTLLTQIADKCPIHKILSNPIHIDAG
ncbi:OsmC family protein [Pedobacter sp. SYP-B3415]|uniref:OsmC family protein n=1 Tax=Pedobacter sp. SYP-B3415 TaxID=2496641 RepID=UPI00101E1FC7|nr:OsmC family protein [Pedobacter sp. SYP-B3415]